MTGPLYVQGGHLELQSTRNLFGVAQEVKPI
jgi:hypothetical protein